jgi:hypothetical protein
VLKVSVAGIRFNDLAISAREKLTKMFTAGWGRSIMLAY